MVPLSQLITALADRYRLERELGQGGMATVCLAQDLTLRPDGHRRIMDQIRRNHPADADTLSWRY
jgi:hypothetical protein